MKPLTVYTCPLNALEVWAIFITSEAKLPIHFLHGHNLSDGLEIHKQNDRIVIARHINNRMVMMK